MERCASTFCLEKVASPPPFISKRWRLLHRLSQKSGVSSTFCLKKVASPPPFVSKRWRLLHLLSQKVASPPPCVSKSVDHFMFSMSFPHSCHSSHPLCHTGDSLSLFLLPAGLRRPAHWRGDALRCQRLVEAERRSAGRRRRALRRRARGRRRLHRTQRPPRAPHAAERHLAAGGAL